MQDLQLWYSKVCLLQFKLVQTGPNEIQIELTAPTRATSHATPASRTDPRRGPAGPARRGRLWPAGPCTVGHPCEPPSGASCRSPLATPARAASRRPRRLTNRAPPYAPHAARPCCAHVATNVVVLCAKASSTALQEPELSLLRACISLPPVCSAAVRHCRSPPSLSLRVPSEKMHAPTPFLSHH
jgi:hypothetical protein